MSANSKPLLQIQFEGEFYIHKPAYEKVVSGYIVQINSLKTVSEKLYLTGNKIGGWMSAALDDESVCAEMKADIRPFLEALYEYRGKK